MSTRILVWILCITFGSAGFLVPSGPASAARFLKTRLPIGNVGTLDPQLSTACQHNQFNQLKVQNLHIGFTGDKGRGITGIATQAYNLRDPNGLARNDTTYHFYNDGYSNCRVYTARFRLPPRQ